LQVGADQVMDSLLRTGVGGAGGGDTDGDADAGVGDLACRPDERDQDQATPKTMAAAAATGRTHPR